MLSEASWFFYYFLTNQQHLPLHCLHHFLHQGQILDVSGGLGTGVTVCSDSSELFRFMGFFGAALPLVFLPVDLDNLLPTFLCIFEGGGSNERSSSDNISGSTLPRGLLSSDPELSSVGTYTRCRFISDISGHIVTLFFVKFTRGHIHILKNIR